jgi:hypothetical protein
VAHLGSNAIGTAAGSGHTRQFSIGVYGRAGLQGLVTGFVKW